MNPYGERLWKNYAGEISQYYNYNNGFVYSHKLDGLNHTGFIKDTMIEYSKRMSGFRSNGISANKHFVIKNSDQFVRNAFKLTDFLNNILLSVKHLCP